MVKYSRLYYNIITLILIFLLIPFVSSFDFDNIKDYDATNKEITITNSLGLGSEIAKIKLLTPSNYYVIAGKDKLVAKLSFIVNKDFLPYENALKEMEFYDLKQAEVKVDRIFKYKYQKLVKTERVTDYTEVCEKDQTLANGDIGEKCHYVESGTHDENIYEWVEITQKDLSELPEGEVIIGIFTDVYSGDVIEWIPTLFGIKIEEWATFSESQKLLLTAYYNMNNTAENIYGTLNFTIAEGAPVFSDTTSILGRAVNLSIGNNLRFNENASQFNNANKSFSFWLYNHVQTGQLISAPKVGGSINYMGYNGDGTYYFKACTAEQATIPSSAVTGKWHHIAYSRNDSGATLYIDGAKSNTCNGGTTYTAYQNFGSDINGAAEPHVFVDEFAIWNRTLSEAEIIDLNNTRATWADTPPVTMTLVQSAPGHYDNVTSQIQSFSCNYSTGNQNISSVSLKIYDSANASIYTNTESSLNIPSYNKTWSNVNVTKDDFFYWSCHGYGSLSVNSSTSNRTLFVDSIAPVVTINYPEEKSYNGNITNFTWSIVDASNHLNSCWFSNNSGKSNITLTCYQNISFSSNATDDGSYVWKIWANDTFGNIGVDTVNFQIDRTIKGVTIYLLHPEDNTINNSANQIFKWQLINKNVSLVNSTLQIWNSSGSLFNYATEDICLQETANISTPCGGLSTGDYYFEMGAVYVENRLKFYDGNYSSATAPFGELIRSFYINYTKPSNASSAVWNYKDGSFNYSLIEIPSSCFNYHPNKLSFKITQSTIPTGKFVNGYCRNSTGDVLLQNFTGGDNFYEESVYWNNLTHITGSVNITKIIPLTDGSYKYNVLTYFTNNSGENISSNIATSNYSFIVDLTSPIPLVHYPTNTTVLRNVPNLWINFSVNDTGTIADCWYTFNSGLVNKSLYSVCNSTNNVTSSDFFNATLGNKRYFLNFYANDTFNSIAKTNKNFYVFNYSQTVSHTIITEGNDVTFTLSLDGVNISNEFSNSNASLRLNGTTYIPDTSSFSNDDHIVFTKKITIPFGMGNSSGKIYPYNWSYNLKSSTTTFDSNTLDNRNLTVLNFSVFDCATSGGRIILNLSIKDEETLNYLNTTSPEVTNIELELNISSKSDPSISWNFHKLWPNNISALVCVPNETLNYSSYKADFIVGFDGTDHVREFYFLDNGTLDNTNYYNSYTDNTIDLFDLLTADSTTFLFSFTDENGLEVEDAIAHTYRKYISEGIFREVERSKQDTNGQTHVHLVEEDVIYYFMITQYGHIIYTSSQYNAKCLSTPCEIILSASIREANWSIIDNEGGDYAVSSNKNTRIVSTLFNLESIDTVNVSLYKFNGTTVLINKSGLTSSGGTINMHVPLVYNNDTFFIAIYRNNTFIKSVWVDFTESGKDYFGTFGMILAGLIVLTIMLMAVSEGVGFIIFTCLSLILVTAMQLIHLSWLAVISLILAGAVIIFKLVSRRNKRN